MANKLAFQAEPTNATFSLGGRIILMAAVNTAIPSTVQPITDANVPAGWTSLGPTENSEVSVTINQTTDVINTGVIPTERKRVLTGQSGIVEATLMMDQPSLYDEIFGISAISNTASTSLNRGYGDLYFGGALGNKHALLILQDFDADNLSEDGASPKIYEQVWLYSPKVQKDGDIDLNTRVNRMYVPKFRAALQGFSNAGAPGKTILLIERWLETT